MVASTLAAYPDAYQRPTWLLAPYLIGAVRVAVCLLQLALEPQPRSQDATDMHGLGCSVSIVDVAIVPSALVIRFQEANNSMIHVLTWHDVPTVLTAFAGVWLGRRLLHW